MYSNNVVLNSNYVWTHQSGASAAADARGGVAVQSSSSPVEMQADSHYKVVDSFFAANHRLSGSGTGARLEYEDISPEFLELVGTTVTDNPVPIEHDQTRRNYLHPVAGSQAATVGAGLFLNMSV